MPCQHMNDTLITVIIILVVTWLINIYVLRFTEGFDASTKEFVPIGSDRYGLRGDLLSRSAGGTWYQNPERHIRLNASGGHMWESDEIPTTSCNQFGSASGSAYDESSSCRAVPCPSNDEYDELDTCWQCNK